MMIRCVVRVLPAVLGVLVASASARADWVSLDGQVFDPRGRAFTGEILRSSPVETVVRLRVRGFDARRITAQGRALTEIRVPGMSATYDRGLPELPRFNFNLMMPFGSRPRVEIVDIREKEIPIGVVAPSKGDLLRNQDPRRVPYEFAPFYAGTQGPGTEVYPPTSARLEEGFVFRDIAGLNLGLRPFRYRAKDGVLLAAAEITVRVLTPAVGGQSQRLFRRPGGIDGSFLRLYDSRIPNFRQLARINPAQAISHLVVDTGRVLIITAPQFGADLESFVTWKRQRGLTVFVATTGQTGTTQEQIKAFIAKMYAEQKISTVILVGDAEHVATHKGTVGNVKGQPADPMYGLIDGADAYPEVMISRLSAKDSTGMQTMLNKIIAYERDPEPGAAWYSMGTGIASDEGSPTDKDRAEILRKMLLGWRFTGVDQFYDPGASAASLSAALNQGRGYINYIGHGSETSWVTSRFSNDHIQSLKNGRRTPFIVSVACVNGAFAGLRESFAERWLLAGTPTAPQGAVAIYASSTNQSWVPPTLGQKAITELLISGKMDTVGMLYVHGGIAVLEDNSDSAEQTFQSWHIFGDATTQVRTQAPAAFPQQISGQLQVSQGRVAVRTGVPGSVASVTTGARLIGAAVTAENGVAVIPLTGQRPAAGQAITLTVTGSNFAPLIREAQLTL